MSPASAATPEATERSSHFAGADEGEASHPPLQRPMRKRLGRLWLDRKTRRPSSAARGVGPDAAVGGSTHSKPCYPAPPAFPAPSTARADLAAEPWAPNASTGRPDRPGAARSRSRGLAEDARGHLTTPVRSQREGCSRGLPALGPAHDLSRTRVPFRFFVTLT